MGGGRQRQLLLLLRMHHLTFTLPKYLVSSVLTDSILSHLHLFTSHICLVHNPYLFRDWTDLLQAQKRKEDWGTTDREERKRLVAGARQ